MLPASIQPHGLPDTQLCRCLRPCPERAVWVMRHRQGNSTHTGFGGAVQELRGSWELLTPEPVFICLNGVTSMAPWPRWPITLKERLLGARSQTWPTSGSRDEVPWTKGPSTQAPMARCTGPGFLPTTALSHLSTPRGLCPSSSPKVGQGDP